MNNKIATTIRLPRPLHRQLKKEAKSQGVKFNTYILSCVQRDRTLRDGAMDSIALADMNEEISRLRGDVASNKKVLETILAAIRANEEREIDLDRARESLIGILFNPSNRKEVIYLTTKDDLASFIIRKAPHLGKHLTATPERPTSLLDEILLELQREEMVKVVDDERIEWGLKAWGA